MAEQSSVSVLSSVLIYRNIVRNEMISVFIDFAIDGIPTNGFLIQQWCDVGRWCPQAVPLWNPISLAELLFIMTPI